MPYVVCVVQRNCVLSPVVTRLLYIYWGKSLECNTRQSSGGPRPISCTHHAFTEVLKIDVHNVYKSFDRQGLPVTLKVGMIAWNLFC